jgi:translation elongation factor EF-G
VRSEPPRPERELSASTVEADARMDARGDAQLPIGLEDNHKGLVDVVRMRAVYFLGDHGQHVEEAEVPAEMREEAAAARVALIEQVHANIFSMY